MTVAATTEPTERPCGKARVRHRPEETVLHQVLSAHFEEFVERAEEPEVCPSSC